MQRLFFILILLLASPCWAEVTAVGASYQDGNGWTQLPANADTFYVSSSIGSDTYDGTSGTYDGGTTGPKATIAAGKALMTSGAGDHLLLKRGDTWTDEQFGTLPAGADDNNLTLIGAYGSGNPPQVVGPAGAEIFNITTGGRGRFAIIGIDFSQNSRDLQDEGKGLRGAIKDGVGSILIEDCTFDGFAINIDISATNDSAAPFNGVTIRRCRILNSWSSGDHSQGIFLAKVTNALIEECIFDHNGWAADWQDTAILASGTSAAFTNGDTLSFACVRYGEYTANGGGLDLELINTNDASGAVASVVMVDQSNGDNIRVSLDLTTGVASNVVAAAIQAYDSGNTFTCTSSGTADLVAADAGTKDNVMTGAVAAEPTIFNHHIYVAEGNPPIYTENIEVRGNVFTRASNHVAKLEATKGTTSFHDNFCAFNGSAGQFGMGSNDIDVEVDGITLELYNNVWVEHTPIGNENNGLGPEIQSVASGFARNNILANRDPVDPDGGYQFLVNDHVDGVGINNFEMEDNVFYNIRGPIQLYDPSGYADGAAEDNPEGDFTTPTVSGNTFKRNHVVLPTGETSTGTFFETSWIDSAEIVYQDNVYFSTGDTADEWFTINGSPVSTTTWQSTHEASASFTEPTYTAPTRTSTTFATSHANGYANWGEWIADLQDQNSQSWDTTIMSDAARAYIFAGFDWDEYDPDASAPTYQTFIPGVLIQQP